LTLKSEKILKVIFVSFLQIKTYEFGTELGHCSGFFHFNEDDGNNNNTNKNNNMYIHA